MSRHSKLLLPKAKDCTRDIWLETEIKKNLLRKEKTLLILATEPRKDFKKPWATHLCWLVEHFII